MTTSAKGNELFSVDKNGKKVDAHLHDPILDNSEAQQNDAKDCLRRLMAQGYPEDMIRSFAKGFAEEQAGKKATPKKFAAGGSAPQKAEYAPWDINQGAHWRIKGAMPHVPHHGGMIKSSIPGRTDKIPLAVKPGSYIIPSDIPSALGQGNSQAGEKILGRMFKIGPYGSGMTGSIKSGSPRMPGFNWMKTPRVPRFAEGGEAEEVPIIAAGGEYVIDPDTVKEIGHGNMDAGHRVLDRFVLQTRKKHIEILKSLKPPKK